MRALALGAVMAALLAAPSMRACAEGSEDAKALVAQLASDDCSQREEAERKLIELGERAEEALKQANESDDPEVKARAAHALEEIQRRRQDRALAEALRRFAHDYPLLRIDFPKMRYSSTLRTAIEKRGDAEVLVCEDQQDAGGMVWNTRDVLDLSSMASVEVSYDLSAGQNGSHFEAKVVEGKLVGTLQTGGGAPVDKEFPLGAGLPYAFAGPVSLRLAACIEPAEGRTVPFTWVYLGTNIACTLVCTSHAHIPGCEEDAQGWEFEVRVGGPQAQMRLWVVPGRGIRRVSYGGDTVEPATK